MIGEKIYSYTVNLGETLEYGISLASILAGEVSVPLHGARFDAPFEGQISGRISGTLSGVDFAFFRPDGVLELDIRARIDAGGGNVIALSASGIGRFREVEPTLDLAENVRLITSCPQFAWVNGRQIWAQGVADLAAGHITLEGFMP